jgi:hypothetical protein
VIYPRVADISCTRGVRKSTGLSYRGPYGGVLWQVVYRRWLVKERYNLSAYKPILISNNSTREITVDNSKLL